MSTWLAGASPIQPKQLMNSCDPCGPLGSLGASEDVLVRYASNTTFQELAIKLAPMMYDLKVQSDTL